MRFRQESPKNTALQATESFSSDAVPLDGRVLHDVVPRIRKRARPKNSTVVDHPLLTNRDAPPLFVEYVATSLIKPYGKALRPIRAKHLAAVMGSLKTFGFVAPIVIDDNNVVVDGHALVVAAERLGIERIPVVRLGHLSPELVNACRVALNKLAEGGRWDEQAIKLEMIEIAPILLTHDIEIEAMGFSMAEFDLMMSSPPEVEPPDDDVIATDASSISVLGDLWLLGKHRLLCGNALENDAYVRLMDGRKARMAFCDAPYNLKVEGVISGLGQVKHREFAMASGEMSRPEFIAFLTTYMKNCAAHSVGGAVHFACMDWRHILELVTAGEAAFDKFLNLVVWNKTNAGMGTMYRSQHELIGVFKSGTLPHTNTFGLGDTGRYRTNCWTVAGANTFRAGRDDDLAAHPTVKPTILVMDAIKDVSHRGEVVLDCFCGSGTTILAAERTGRLCFGMELDPLYVDVAVRRWQRLTGGSATLEGDNRSFDEIGSSRSGSRGSTNV